ncbi:hypothetical protein WAI453_011291 [Rhynchosporium graminicola]
MFCAARPSRWIYDQSSSILDLNSSLFLLYMPRQSAGFFWHDLSASKCLVYHRSRPWSGLETIIYLSVKFHVHENP